MRLNYFCIGLVTFFLALEFPLYSDDNPSETVEKANPRIPLYQQSRPLWGFEMAGSLKALGGSPVIPNLGDAKVSAASLQLELQPKFLQRLGVFGLGPSFEVNPVNPFDGITSTAMGGLWSIGGQIRYQARFFLEQPIVPVVGYCAQYWNYRLADGTAGRFWAKGPVLGAMILLNFLDTDAAAEFFVDFGVSRTYLVAELRNIAGNDSVISFSGSSLFGGLRFEF